MTKFALYFISLLRTLSSIITDNYFQHLLKKKHQCVFLCRNSFLWLIRPLLQAPTYCFHCVIVSWSLVSVCTGTSLHLFLHCTEEDGLLARAQPTDRRLALVSRPDSGGSFLHSAPGCHWNHVLHPGGLSPKQWRVFSLWPLVGHVLLMSPSLQLGAESGIDNPNLRAMKTVFRVMPFIILPLTINFPTVCLLFSLMTFFVFVVSWNMSSRLAEMYYLEAF